MRQSIKAVGGQLKTLHGSGSFDLRSMGRATINRSSLINFDEQAQKFYIEFLEPELVKFNQSIRNMFFDEYKDAANKEIDMINEYRRQGVLA